MRIDNGCRPQLRSAGYAFLAYLVLTAFLFRELLGDLSGSLLGIGDHYFHHWNVWWLTEGAWKEGQSLLWTTYQYHPTGLPLHLQAFNFFQLFWSLPLVWLFGREVGQNCVLLSSFVLTGFVTYLLARKLGFKPGPAFLSGLILMMCPLQFAQAQAGHYSVISLHWMILPLLLLIHWLEKRTLHRAAALGISLVILFYSSWYLLIYTGLLLAAWLAAWVYEQPKRLQDESFWKSILLAAGSTAILALPLLWPTLVHLGEFERPSGHLIFSADLAGLFVPGSQSLYGEYTRGIWERFTGLPGENGTYLGYTVLVLAVLGAWSGRKGGLRWVVVALIALCLSLGPYLHVAGTYEIPIEQLGVLKSPAAWLRETALRLNPSWSISTGHVALPLPYLLLKELPLFSVSRVPSRFVAIVYLCLAILAAAGLAAISRPAGRTRTGVYVLCWSLVLVEYFPDLRSSPVRVSPFFTELAEKPGDFAILDLSYKSRRVLHQTRHGKKTLGGYASRNYIPAKQFLERVGLWEVLETGKGEVDLTPSIGEFRELDVRYVVLPRPYEMAALALKEGRRIYEDPEILVYEVTPPE